MGLITNEASHIHATSNNLTCTTNFHGSINTASVMLLEPKNQYTKTMLRANFNGITGISPE